MGRVVRGELTGGDNLCPVGHIQRCAKSCLYRLRRQPACAQQRRAGLVQADDGAFQTHGAGAVINHSGDPPFQPRQNMLRRCGADLARGVGRGGRHRTAKRTQNGAGRGVRGHADADAVQPRRHQRREPVPVGQRQHECHRAGPEGACQNLGGVGPAPVASRLIYIGDMDDQRVEAGPALGLVDARHRRPVTRIRPQTIDRFSR